MKVSLILREKYPEYEQGAVISKFASSVGEAIEKQSRGCFGKSTRSQVFK